MSRGLSIAVVAALFLSGVTVGALGMHLYYWDRLSPHRMSGPPDTPWVSGWMERELDLSADQKTRIEAILADSRKRSAEIRYEVKPRVEALMTETSKRIAEVLTEDQRQRFERLQRLQRHRLERGFLGPPGGRSRSPAPPDPRRRRARSRACRPERPRGGF